MIEFLSDPQIWLSLLTLAALEIVLGIDNLLFLNIVASRVKPEQQALARKIGLLFALGTRIVLLFSISWIIGLTKPLFSILTHEISIRDIILIGGGIFLLTKGTLEIHHAVENNSNENINKKPLTFISAVIQIAILDLVFSLDSVITAVGMADHLSIMIIAVVIAMIIMLVSADAVGNFIQKHPTIKMLALSFLILIGIALIADGLHFHIPKGYLYFAIAFSAGVEMLNMLVRKNRSKSSDKEKVDQEYVLAFIFDESLEKVLLIQKQRPQWQAGLYNGIGGKIEEKETAIDAIKREIFEEANLEITSFIPIETLTDNKTYRVYCYTAKSDFKNLKSKTDEIISVFSVKNLPDNIIDNVPGLIKTSLEKYKA